MFSRIQDGLIQETGPLAVCEGSARLKMMPVWFGFGRAELFFKRRALWPCAKDQPAWRRRLLFRFILRLSGRQSKRMENNDTMIPKKWRFYNSRNGPFGRVRRISPLEEDAFFFSWSSRQSERRGNNVMWRLPSSNIRMKALLSN